MDRDRIVCQAAVDNTAAVLREKLAEVGPGAPNPKLKEDMILTLVILQSLPFKTTEGVKIPPVVRICLPMIEDPQVVKDLEFLENLQHQVVEAGDMLASQDEVDGKNRRSVRIASAAMSSAKRETRDWDLTESSDEEDTKTNLKKRRMVRFYIFILCVLFQND